MNRVRLVTACLLVVWGGAIATAQKPAFSGTWIIQPPNKAAGMEQVVTQNDKTLSVTIGGRTMTHTLDGVERREARTVRVGEIVMVTKAAWEGNRIVVTTSTAYPNNMKTLGKETWSIDAQGQLVIELTETAEGQPPRVMKVTHKKKG